MKQTKKRPLLSILIPTYNGASSYLDRVLEISKSIIIKHNNVEVVVSDNCSVDGTEELCEQYINHESFRYYRNEKNLGFNRNMLLLAQKYSRGIYSWFVGDDDLINVFFVSKVLERLKSQDIDFISLRYQIVKESFNYNTIENTDAFFRDSSYATAISENCENGNAFATFIGGSIFKTDVFNEVPTGKIENKFDVFYNIWPNAYILATAFHNRRCAYTKSIGIYPIARDKGWNNSDNNYRLNSQIVFDLYNYVTSLGVSRKELKKTYERILFLNVEGGIVRLRHAKKISPIFFKTFIISLFYPKVWSKIFGEILFKIKELIRNYKLILTK